MKSTSSDPASDPASARARGPYSCDLPWTGVLDVQTNGDVVFCPCFLALRIGNLSERSLQEIWNAPQLVELRETFGRGELPAICEGQLCPPVLSVGRHVR